MRRGLDIDGLECPKCRARMRFVACIVRPTVIRHFLRNLGLPSEPIVLTPARAPPHADPIFDLDVA